MSDYIAIEVGQVWQDWDKRFRDSPYPRMVRIVSLVDRVPQGRWAICENVQTGKITRISAERLKPDATGYKLVKSESHREASPNE